MIETNKLKDDLFRARVLQARDTPPLEKLLAGPRLFDAACQTMRAGIRHQFPQADEATCQRELQRRLRIQRALESS